MGKEIYLRKTRTDIKVCYTDTKPYIRWILAQYWSKAYSIPESNNIVNDGKAEITLNGKLGEFMIIAKGLKPTGNSYVELIVFLRYKKIVPLMTEKLGIFIKDGFMWEPINIHKDFFNSGDSILIIYDSIGKSIKKTGYKNKIKEA